MRTPRGQMILIAAVLVSVTVLGSVVLLNTLHVPADINTDDQDRNLAALDRTSGQVVADVEALFLAHTSLNRTGERLPYANESGGPDPPFGAVIENYSAVRADLTATGAAAALSVAYLNTSEGSRNGTFLRHNDTTRNFTADRGEWDAVAGAASVPYLFLRVNGTDEDGDPLGGTHPFEVAIDGTVVTFRNDEVVVPGAGNLAGDHDSLYPVELELIDGVGAVRNGTQRSPLAIDVGPDADVRFRNGNETTGTYAISGTDVDSSDLIGDEASGYQYTREGVLVNPKIRLNVTRPDLRFSRTVALYNRSEP